MRAKILVAEDDLEMRNLVVGALRREGHEVTDMPDGGRLLVFLAKCCREELPVPDLIVSDVRMPVMTGLAMLKGVREAHWMTPVVLMTAFPDADTRWRAESLDATVLAKPFSMQQLCSVVASILSLRTAEAAGRP